jgi:hypothetical protein
MATFTRVNGISGQRGTFASTLQLKAFKIVPATAFVDGVDSTGELTAREIGTTGALINVKNDGTSMVVVGDGHALDVNALARRVDMVLGGSGVFTGTGTTSLVTVTELTSFYSIT